MEKLPFSQVTQSVEQVNGVKPKVTQMRKQIST